MASARVPLLPTAENNKLELVGGRDLIPGRRSHHARGSCEPAEQEHVNLPWRWTELQTARQGTARTPAGQIDLVDKKQLTVGKSKTDAGTGRVIHAER